MDKSKYSVELTKMLRQLEDPDAKRPRLSRFKDLNQEEREIYMNAVMKQPKEKVDDVPSDFEIAGRVKIDKD